MDSRSLTLHYTQHSSASAALLSLIQAIPEYGKLGDLNCNTKTTTLMLKLPIPEIVNV